VRACQQGLAAEEVEIRYQQNPNPDELYTDIEAEQQHGDEQVGLQTSSSTASPQFKGLHRGEVPAPELTCMSPQTFLPIDSNQHMIHRDIPGSMHFNQLLPKGQKQHVRKKVQLRLL
jgi:hypothetical protein